MISWILLRNTELTQKEGNWPTQKTAELCSYNIAFWMLITPSYPVFWRLLFFILSNQYKENIKETCVLIGRISSTYSNIKQLQSSEARLVVSGMDSLKPLDN